MLKRGRYCLMKLCSASSASASLATTTHSMCSTLATISAWPGTGGHLGLGEVRGDALADRLGLADVDDAALGVAKQIDPRLVGQSAALLGDARAPLLGWARLLRGGAQYVRAKR